MKVQGRAFEIPFVGDRETVGLGEEFVLCRGRGGALCKVPRPGELDVEAMAEDADLGGSARCFE
jgi:hypothetical protein